MEHVRPTLHEVARMVTRVGFRAHNLNAAYEEFYASVSEQRPNYEKLDLEFFHGNFYKLEKLTDKLYDLIIEDYPYLFINSEEIRAEIENRKNEYKADAPDVLLVKFQYLMEELRQVAYRIADIAEKLYLESFRYRDAKSIYEKALMLEGYAEATTFDFYRPQQCDAIISSEEFQNYINQIQKELHKSESVEA